MKKQVYKDQVQLLLDVIPEVEKEECFALHGGTAINLFVRNMPRLSVDIDLTYIPLEDRETTFNNISKALERIKNNIETTLVNAVVQHKPNISKLLVARSHAQIKIEVNQTNRGLIKPPQTHTLCDTAQEEFDVFCTITVVDHSQLYGGKICAALDRQHPRDLFDVKHLLDREGFTDNIKDGFMYCLLCSSRPVEEMLFPNLLDQSNAMENQFDGMTRENFSYKDFEQIRHQLIQTIQSKLTQYDKKFLIDFVNTTPDWEIYDFEKFPSVQWKLKNLIKLKSDNPRKHLKMVKKLKERLSAI